MTFKRTLLVGAIVCGGCSIIDSAQSLLVVGGLLVKTPAIMLPGQIEMAGETVATAWVAERASGTSTEAPTPIGDATARVNFAGNSVALPVADAERGVYSTNSVETANLVYVSGGSYSFEADTRGATVGGAISAAPTELTPAALVLSPRPTAAHPTVTQALLHPAGAKLEVSWGDQYGRYPYVTVLRADPADPSRPTIVFDTRPQNAQDVLDLVVSPSNSIEIPADTFAANGIYAVLVVALDRGTNLLPNTFLGSPILVGSSAAVFIGVTDGS